MVRFSKKYVIDYKSKFDFLYNFYLKYVSLYEELSGISSCVYTGLHPKYSLFLSDFNPYPTAFPYGNGMVLHFYQQQESSATETVHKVINKGLKAYV